MTRVALRGLLGRKLRTALTAVAIVLGVALVAGTLILTDSISKAFDNIFTDSRQGSSVVISGKSAFDLTDDSGATAPPLNESLLQTVREQPDVAAAEGSVNGEAQLIGDDNKAIVYGGAPNLGFSIENGNSPFNPLSLVEGSWPSGDEVVIDGSTADKEGFVVGDTVGVQGRGPVEQLRISGIVKFGSVSTIGGATLAGFDLPTAQRVFDMQGKLDEIAVAAKAGVSDEQLAQALGDILPRNTQVRTADEQAQNDAKDTNSFISFLRTFLLSFGGIALFVGAFVIANSLSITIAQRTRELATLTHGWSVPQAGPEIDHPRGHRRRRARLCRRPVPRPRAGQRSLLALRPDRLHPSQQRPALRDAHDRGRPPRGRPRHARGKPPPRDSSDEGPADRGGSRRSDPSGIEVREVPYPGRPAAHGSRLRRRDLRPLRTRSRDGGDPPLHGCWSAARLLRRRALRLEARPSIRVIPRLAHGPLRGSRWAACSRQRQAESAADRLDRGCPHDRARACHTRRRPRTGDSLELHRGRRQDLRLGLRDHGAEQLLPDPDRRRRRRSERAGGRGCRQCPRRPSARVRECRLGDRRHTERRSGNCTRLGRRLPVGLQRSRRERRIHRQRLREEAQPEPRLADQDHRSERQRGSSRRQGHLRPAAGRLAVRTGDLLKHDVRPELRSAGESLLVREDEGRRHRCQYEGARRLSEGVPECQGADPRSVQGQPGQLPEQDSERALRAPGAVGDREPLRNHQHAGAHRLRANAGDRDATGCRNDAEPGPKDDPVREHHHGAHRSGPRNRARDRPRGPPDRSQSTSSTSRCRPRRSSSSRSPR